MEKTEPHEICDTRKNKGNGAFYEGSDKRPP